MKTKKITCDHCGAGLAIEGTPNYVDCRFCGSSLRVVRTESAIYTEVRAEVKAIGAEVSGLRKESKLRALEERWHKQQMDLAIGNWPGPMSKHHPTKGAAKLFGLLGGGSTLVFGIMALYFRGADKGFSFFTTIITGILTLIGIVWANHRHDRYLVAERAYLARRKAIQEAPPKRRGDNAEPPTSDESAHADRPSKRKKSTKKQDSKRSSST